MEKLRWPNCEQNLTWPHEFMHVIDVILFVKAKLDKIEAEYKSGKLTEAEAKDNIRKAFNRAMKASKNLRDNFISQYMEIIINGIKELFPEYGIDLFWQWVLAPYLRDLASFAY